MLDALHEREPRAIVPIGVVASGGTETTPEHHSGLLGVQGRHDAADGSVCGAQMESGAVQIGFTNFAFERVVAQLIDMRAAEGFAKYDALALGQTGAVDCRQECLPARRWNVRVAGEYAPLEQTSRIGSSAGLHNVQSNAFHD